MRPYSFFPFGGKMIRWIAAGLMIFGSVAAYAAQSGNGTLHRVAAKSARAWMDYISRHSTLTGEQMVLAYDIFFARAKFFLEARYDYLPSEEEEDSLVFPQVIWVRALPGDDLQPMFAAMGEMGGAATARYTPSYTLDLNSSAGLINSVKSVTEHGELSELIVLDPFLATEENVSAFVDKVLRTLNLERVLLIVDRNNLYPLLTDDLKEQISVVGESACERLLRDPDEYR